jgi:hypothetical protein
MGPKVDQWVTATMEAQQVILPWVGTSANPGLVSLRNSMP